MQALVLDLSTLHGYSSHGEQVLGACAQQLGPTLVLNLPSPDHLDFTDERLLSLPRAHSLGEAFTALNLLNERNTRQRTRPAEQQPRG